MKPQHFLTCIAAFLVTYHAALHPSYPWLLLALCLTAAVHFIPTLPEEP